MGDSLITVVAIFLAAILMFVFPLMTVSERTDDISQLAVQSATNDFVDEVRTTGKLTADSYAAFVQTLVSTGNSYDIEMEAQMLDENPGVKTTQAETTKIGENIYYKLYTTQIEDAIGVGNAGSGDTMINKDNTLTFKEGDRFSVTVRNSNTTIGQTLRNFLYRLAGNDSYEIAAQQAGIVTVNGTK